MSEIRYADKLWLDLETRNKAPINVGTHAYAQTVEITLFAWALDDDPVQVWDLTANPAPPKELQYAKYNEVWAHNSAFDRTMLRHYLPSLITQDRTMWRDTMVQALAHSLPAGLGNLGEVLGIETDQAKDKDGRRLMLMFCKPMPSGVWRTRETHPEEWAKFVAYAGRDVEAMRACHKKMPNWNYKGRELDLWHLDQKINDRGVGIDMDLVHGAISAVDAEQKRLAYEAAELTDGELSDTRKRNRMLDYIANTFGVIVDNLQWSTVEKMLSDDDIDETLRELLVNRLASTTSSTAKYKTLAKGTSKDGRLRGLLQFCGASRSARWAGRLFQPQNLKRSTLKQVEIETAIEAVKLGSLDLICG